MRVPGVAVPRDGTGRLGARLASRREQRREQRHGPGPPWDAHRALPADVSSNNGVIPAHRVMDAVWMADQLWWSRREDHGVKPGARRAHHLMRVAMDNSVRRSARRRPTACNRSALWRGVLDDASSSEGSCPSRRPARRGCGSRVRPRSSRRESSTPGCSTPKRTAGGRDHAFVVPLGNHDSGVGGLMDDHVVGPHRTGRPPRRRSTCGSHPVDRVSSVLAARRDTRRPHRRRTAR